MRAQMEKYRDEKGKINKCRRCSVMSEQRLQKRRRQLVQPRGSGAPPCEPRLEAVGRPPAFSNKLIVIKNGVRHK